MIDLADIRFRVERLDGRYTGHQVFTHRARIDAMVNKVWSIYDYRQDQARASMTAMDWFWQTFGPTVPRNQAMKLYWARSSRGNLDELVNSYWSWHEDERQIWFYMTEDGYTRFALQFQ